MRHIRQSKESLDNLFKGNSYDKTVLAKEFDLSIFYLPASTANLAAGTKM